MFLKHPDDSPRRPHPPEHEHRYGLTAKRGVVGWCQVDGCTDYAVSTGKRWRPPTSDEQLTILARMMEDLCYVDALTIVHHNDRRYAVNHIAQMRGY